MRINYKKIDSRSKLDEYYSDSLKTVKSGLLYGSHVDTRESLENYENKLELYMHLDGYNGAEITQMKCDAIISATKKPQR